MANPCFARNDWGAQRFHGSGQSVHVSGSTAVTADQLHCSPSSTPDPGGGGGLTAVTADQLHCSPSSTLYPGGGGGV